MSSAASIVSPEKTLEPIIMSVIGNRWQENLRKKLNEIISIIPDGETNKLMEILLDQGVRTLLAEEVAWLKESNIPIHLSEQHKFKLLERTWPELIILGYLHQRLNYDLPNVIELDKNIRFNLHSLAVFGNLSVANDIFTLQNDLRDLDFDSTDYAVLKYLMFLNPGTRFSDPCLSKYHDVIVAYRDIKSRVVRIQSKCGKMLAIMHRIRRLAKKAVVEYLEKIGINLLRDVSIIVNLEKLKYETDNFAITELELRENEIGSAENRTIEF